MKKLLKNLLVIPTSLVLLLAGCDNKNSTSASVDSSSIDDSTSSSSSIDDSKSSSSSIDDSASSSSSSSSSSQSSDLTVKAISVKEMPDTTVFKMMELDGFDGLVIQKEMSDGSFVELTDDDYTIDYDSIDYTKSGKYNVLVKLNEDDSITTSFEIEFIVPKTLTLKEGYKNNFLLNRMFDYYDYEFTVTYTDGSSEEVSTFSISDDDPNMYEKGEKEVTFRYGYYDEATTKYVTTTATINVYDPLDLTVNSFDVDDIPEDLSFAFSDKDSVSDAFNGIYCVATYEEMGEEEFTVDKIYFEEDDGYSIDYSNIEEATKAGVYNVVINYHDKSVDVPVTLLDVSEYTLSEIQYDSNTIPCLEYYVKETLNGYYIIPNISMNYVYKKDGSEDIIVPVISYSNFYLEEEDEELTTAGKKTLHIKVEGNDDLEISYEVTIKDVPTLANGIYLNNYNYERVFRVNNGIINLYDFEEGIYQYDLTFSDLWRCFDDDGEQYLELDYYNEDESISFSVNFNIEDGSLRNYYKMTEDDHFLTLNFTYSLNDYTYEFFVKDGIVTEDTIPESYSSLLDLITDSYVMHKDSESGEVIDSFIGYTLTQDTTIYAVFETKSGEGKEFIGKYDGIGEKGTGASLDIVSDMIILYSPNESGGLDETIILYTYEEDNGKFDFKTNSYYKLSYEKDKLVFSIEFFGQKIEVEFEKRKEN